MTLSVPIEYESFLNRSIFPIDWTLTGTTTSGQRGLENNPNESVLHISLVFKIRASPVTGWYHTYDISLGVGVLQFSW